MLRIAIVYHLVNYDGTNAGTSMQTFDFACPELEKALTEGRGSNPTPVGVEVIPPSVPA